jgi:hypothetical protein
MDSRSEAVVVLRESADINALMRKLQDMHLRLEPIFHDAISPAAQGWYLLIADPATNDDDLDAILQTIRGMGGVDAAYRKPAGEPPQESSR